MPWIPCRFHLDRGGAEAACDRTEERGWRQGGAWTRRLLVALCCKRRGMVALLSYPDFAPSSVAAAPACIHVSAVAGEEYGGPA
jgi:hypothetical protein